MISNENESNKGLFDNKVIHYALQLLALSILLYFCFEIAILLTIWMLFIGIIDNILKPVMMGVGAPAPMLVVFIGTIGGFIFNGFIGLFTGAIILTIGYQLLMNWLGTKPTKTTMTEEQLI